MAKKRFTDGLESLFADVSGEVREKEKHSAAKSRQKEKQPESKKSSGKDFSSSLHSFLQEAFEESFEQQMRKENAEPAAASQNLKKRSRKPNSGLDALIRNTLEPSSMRIDPNTTRRLVVTFKEEQLDRLKSIARKEKRYLKQIINEIVEEFIQTYDRK